MFARQIYFGGYEEMLKRILALVLCAAMLVAVFMMSGCDSDVVYEDDDTRLPLTLTVLGITGPTTKHDDVKAVENAINAILRDRFEIKLNLEFVTMDKYLELVKEKNELADYDNSIDAAIKRYNDYAQRLANQAQQQAAALSGKTGKWTKGNTLISADTVPVRPLYTAQETIVYENGRIEIVYPDSEHYEGSVSPVDIIMIADKEMYDEFDEAGYLESVKSLLSLGSNDITFTKINQYIYPTYLEQLSAITGDIKAIPNNNLLAEYTYLVVDKALADKYDFNVDAVSSYADMESFLSSVKASEDVTPLTGELNPLGIFKMFGDDIAIGTYFDPIYGYNTEEGKTFKVQNLFDIPEYVSQLSLFEKYEKAGYTGDGDSFAAKVIVGDASVEKNYADGYYVKVLQNPFVCREAIFDGMLAVSSKTSDPARALQIIETINTDSDIKNLLQYGIEGVHYTVNEDGNTITRLNDNYMMDNALTGNVYMGYPEEGMDSTTWSNYMLTNLSSSLSPFLTYYVSEQSLDGMLNSVIEYAALKEAFAPAGVVYEDYLANSGTSQGNRLVSQWKTYYKEFLISKIVETGVKPENASGRLNNLSDPVFTTKWCETKMIEKMKAEKYSTILTNAAIALKVNETVASSAGMSSDSFTNAKKNASNYFTNIEYLRIMTLRTLFSDATKEEKAAYNSMTTTNFEKAVLDVIKADYIEKNNVTDEKYDELVKQFISTMLQFTDPVTNNTYYVSWDEFLEEKASASDFIGVMDKLNEHYSDLLNENYSKGYLSMLNSVEIGEAIHSSLYTKWLRENNTTAKEFENSVKDEILAPLGITYTELQTLSRTDATSYRAYIDKVKSKYKKIILEKYTLDEYKAGPTRISYDEVFNTIIDYYVEQKTGVYADMCDVAGISYTKYKEYADSMSTYVDILTMMRDKLTYTLLSKYTASEISSFTYEEIETNVYNIVYEDGFYMNLLAQYVGYSLRDYMLAKSNAKAYTDAIAKLIGKYSAQLTAAGYDIAELATETPSVTEDIIRGIITAEETSSYKNIFETLTDISAFYIKGAEDAEDIASYCTESGKALDGNMFFNAVVSLLQSDLKSKLSAE